MKKYIVITLLTLCLLLVGCNSTANPTSYDKVLDNQNIEGYQPYSIYLFDMQSNFDAKNVAFDAQKIEIMKTLKEESISEQNIDLISLKVDAQYINTKATVGRRAAMARNYVTPYGSVMLDPDTNKVVELSFKVSEKIDVDKDAPKITKEEGYNIALKYLHHFGFDPSQGNYKLQKNDLRTMNEGTNYQHNFYSYVFTKQFDGMVTTDVCYIGISEYGSLLYYTRGDEMDDSILNEISIDYTRVETLANEYAKQICDKINSDSIGYELSTPYLLMLDDATYAISYTISISYTLADAQLSTGVSIVVPVS